MYRESAAPRLPSDLSMYRESAAPRLPSDPKTRRRTWFTLLCALHSQSSSSALDPTSGGIRASVSCTGGDQGHRV